jgi:hypothetical protein
LTVLKPVALVMDYVRIRAYYISVNLAMKKEKTDSQPNKK